MKFSTFLKCILFVALMSAVDGLAQTQVQPPIAGKVIDIRSSTPIPFATIKLKVQQGIVISNAAGDFRLPPKEQLINDTLVVSCIGYNTKIIVVRTIAADETLVIKLEPALYILPEIDYAAEKEKRLTAREIMRRAIEHIPDNYPVNPFSFIGYYRDYQIHDGEYNNLNEAIVEVFDKGFKSDDQADTQIGLYAYNKNKDFVQDTALSGKYDDHHNKFVPGAVMGAFGGNELSILKVHDAIRNHDKWSYSWVGIFDKDFLQNHFFTRKPTVPLNDVLLYCLTFESHEEVSGKSHTAIGKIYIEKDNYAIHKLEYTTYRKAYKKLSVLYDIQLEYARSGSLMYLNYISFNNFFQVKDPNYFRAIDKELNRPLKAFVITFNHDYDTASVTKRDNYILEYEGKDIPIAKIERDVKQKQVTLYMRDPLIFNLYEFAPKLAAKLKIEFRRIKDKEGMEIDKPTFKDVNQFRELFAEKINVTGEMQPELLPLEKSKPLSTDDVTSSAEAKEKYWMNTPLKKKQ